VLDISRLDQSAEERVELADELRSILYDHGFFYLAGHGVDPVLVERTQQVSKAFFRLPTAEKEAVSIARSPQFRGYTRAGGELTRGRPDQREQLDFDREEDALDPVAGAPAWTRTIGPNQWPEAIPEMRAIISAYQAEMTRVALNVLRAVALALGQEEDFFLPLFDGAPRQHLKLLRYPGSRHDESRQGVGAHKDGGLITILLQDHVAGLQVESDSGDWIPVPPIEGTFVVNTGELLELATNGFVCADVHAALSPPAGTERYSIAFFLGANHRGTIPVIDLPPELAAMQRGVTSDPDNPMLRDIGANHLKARLRSHPDVALAHYRDLLDSSVLNA
jgi:isopenicillin N synthase-like dioxygenase